jgi:hypothetical protein
MAVSLGRSLYWVGGILGGPFLFEGEVVVGDRRGRELGSRPPTSFPTTRWSFPGTACTRPGHTGIRRRSRWGFARRSRPAAACSRRHAFETVDALVGQMQRNIVEAREICETTGYPAAALWSVALAEWSGLPGAAGAG